MGTLLRLKVTTDFIAAVLMQLKHLLSDYMRHYTLSCSVSFNMDRMCYYFMLIKH